MKEKKDLLSSPVFLLLLGLAFGILAGALSRRMLLCVICGVILGGIQAYRSASLHKMAKQYTHVEQTMEIMPFTEENAQEMCGWKYAAPYDVYNCPEWSVMQQEQWAVTIPEKRTHEFYAVSRQNEFIGFFRLVKKDNAVMVSLGLAPQQCGAGLGIGLVRKAIQTAREHFDAIPLHMEVRRFNVRAQKCYQAAGFRIIGQYTKFMPSGSVDFVLMELIPSAR